MMNAKHLKHRLMLKLSRESRPTLPEVRESPPDEDVFTARRQSLPLLPALRRSSIVYEENIPVVVRRRGVTMTVRIFGAEDDQGPGEETGKEPAEVGGARVARSASCSEQPGCSSPTKRFSLAARKKRTSKSVSSLEDVRKGLILCK